MNKNQLNHLSDMVDRDVWVKRLNYSLDIPSGVLIGEFAQIRLQVWVSTI